MLGDVRIHALLVAFVAVNVGRSFWSDGTELDGNRVLLLVEMCQSMAVSSEVAAELFAAAAEVTTLQAQPQVLLDITLVALTQG